MNPMQRLFKIFLLENRCQLRITWIWIYLYRTNPSFSNLNRVGRILYHQCIIECYLRFTWATPVTLTAPPPWWENQLGWISLRHLFWLGDWTIWTIYIYIYIYTLPPRQHRHHFQIVQSPSQKRCLRLIYPSRLGFFENPTYFFWTPAKKL